MVTKVAQSIFLILLAVTLSAESQANDLAALRNLAHVVEQCIERKNTEHPIFNGCIDWHSSVHGHWALLWAAHRLNDRALSQKILQRFTVDDISQEFENFQRIDSWYADFEMPYGRAWFLQLARDAEALYGFTGLRPLADHIFTTLLEYARQHGGDIAATDYQNASWYLYQLLRWSEFRCDEPIANEIRQLLRDRIGIYQIYPAFESILGFFDPKALAALALGSADSTSEAFFTIVNSYENDPLNPKQFPLLNIHQGGLNYSRSWGLWALSGLTGDPKFSAAAKEHQKVMEEMIDVWSQDYYRYGHWVGQFGLFSDRMRAEFLDLVVFNNECSSSRQDINSQYALKYAPLVAQIEGDVTRAFKPIVKQEIWSGH